MPEQDGGSKIYAKILIFIWFVWDFHSADDLHTSGKFEEGDFAASSIFFEVYNWNLFIEKSIFREKWGSAFLAVLELRTGLTHVRQSDLWVSENKIM